MPLARRTLSTYIFQKSTMKKSTVYTQNVDTKLIFDILEGALQNSENLWRWAAESDKPTPKSWTNLLQETVALFISLKQVALMQIRPYNDLTMTVPHKLSLAARPVSLMTFLYTDNLKTRSNMCCSCLAVIADIEQSTGTTTITTKIKDKNFDWDLSRFNKYFQPWSHTMSEAG